VHVLEAATLLPGHEYFVTLRLSDRDGRWSLPATDPFATKRRTVTLGFPVIHLFNDGDNHGSGEAEFGVSVYRGEWDGQMRHVGGRQLADDDNPMTVTTGMPDFATGFAPLTIGPDRYRSHKDCVKVIVHGVEYDGIGESNEHAANFLHHDSLGAIPMPTGRGKETVALDGTWHTALPMAGSDTFSFALFVWWQISYS
jgi:hypothetical protein